MKKTTIKNLVLSLLIITASAGAMLGLSRAVFQDAELVDPTISMGVLNLQVGDSDPASVPLDFSGMKPEEIRSYSFDVKNIGQVEGDFWLSALITESSEGENPEPEPVTFFEGDIAQCAKLTLAMTDTQNNQVVLINNQFITNIHQQSYDAVPGTLIDEAVNTTGSIATLTIDTNSCGSDTMGDILKVNLLFQLLQTG